MKTNTATTVAQLAKFDEVIDVRSPGEFALDHIPGAENFPVLDDAERARVGTLYKQVSPFEARKLGAALVARNIARHLEQSFLAKPKNWQPLVYCWRGGKRSAAMVTILREIGWHAMQLEGGYQSYRRRVIADLQALPAQVRFRVVCGLTGSGKSLLLQALDRLGAQVLDLEALAAHRGSVLGNLPGAPQPTQKMFESTIWEKLRRFDPRHPVFVEAESKKIGKLHIPDALIESMRAGSCLRLETGSAWRVVLLKREYAHFLQQPQLLKQQLDHLTELYGRERLAAWHALIDAGHWDEAVEQLLVTHYDPAYTKSTLHNYRRLAEAATISLAGIDDAAFVAAARQAMASC
ncbi:MAG: tRNA 2-selenouridine(34) synthase MnmH [Pseudomonadota bacterium]